MRRWQITALIGLLSAVSLSYQFILYPKSQLFDDTTQKNPFQSASYEKISPGFLHPNASFGACLMMKEDNDLLYEWIAYHYLMLPLRYLVIGSDEGNTHDPRDVLQRWDNETGLKHWVIEAEDFAYRHGPFKAGKKKEAEDYEQHHRFIHRQKGFVTACSELMKKQRVRWVVYTDNDEFIVLNPFSKDDDEAYHSLYSNNTTYLMRKFMTYNMSGFNTVLDVINEIERVIEPIPSCTVMPRLRFGATEKVSCTKAKDVDHLAKTNYDYPSMSTLRYKQHAGKANFEANKYGKVFVDLSRISNDSLAQIPKNVHRPFKTECPFAVKWFHDVLFSINHYTASWERYIHRLDGRRSCEKWIDLAFFDKENSCDQQIHRWLPQFESMFGREKAQYLLGVNQTKQVVSNETCPPEGYNFQKHRRKYGWNKTYSPI